MYTHLRSLISFRIERISNSFLQCTLPTTLHKLIINTLMDIGSRPSCAALAHVEEKAKMSLLYSQVH